jgi:hypothetical protein
LVLTVAGRWICFQRAIRDCAWISVSSCGLSLPEIAVRSSVARMWRPGFGLLSRHAAQRSPTVPVRGLFLLGRFPAFWWRGGLRPWRCGRLSCGVCRARRASRRSTCHSVYAFGDLLETGLRRAACLAGFLACDTSGIRQVSRCAAFPALSNTRIPQRIDGNRQSKTDTILRVGVESRVRERT